MTSHKVLVVEDDPTINEAISARLRSQGYDVRQAFDGPGAVLAAQAENPDVVLLDVMLPGFDGLEVCRQVQAVRPVPVLMLTARDDEADILTGLGVGADDYLTKPFSLRELTARVAALLRRVERAAALAAQPPAQLTVGSLSLDAGTRRTSVAGTAIHLTPTEFDLAVRLAQDPEQVLTREQLLRDVWDWGDSWASASATRTVDTHVRALRAKIGAARIRTVHGVGYSLEDIE